MQLTQLGGVTNIGKKRVLEKIDTCENYFQCLLC